MGEWTWLFKRFPLADMEVAGPPLDPRVANVLVRTFRRVPDEGEEARYEVRVAPHNVAPFRGGPWLRTFTESELEEPGEAVARFRDEIAREIARIQSGSSSEGAASAPDAGAGP
ncbi:hypothetical protein [Alicyclobacillus sp.]|uniref:hypothetical protein n=1 Tax=Alicyclobacillus sp. TaxID=61169 RepID=UPI0025C3CC66|nr:hypothetical protein [Alicyclobacillus sp.]MCL6516402.1 hypothetical protein [Alicyclobacillus sp.]